MYYLLLALLLAHTTYAARFDNKCGTASAAKDCKYLGYTGCLTVGAGDTATYACTCSATGEQVPSDDAEAGDCASSVAYDIANSVITVTVITSITLFLVILIFGFRMAASCRRVGVKYGVLN